MYIIGENIHIISQKVKDALAAKDAKFFQELAVKQVEGGAQALDINLGPRKKDGEVVFPWMVEVVEAVALSSVSGREISLCEEVRGKTSQAACVS